MGNFISGLFIGFVAGVVGGTMLTTAILDGGLRLLGGHP